MRMMLSGNFYKIISMLVIVWSYLPFSTYPSHFGDDARDMVEICDNAVDDDNDSLIDLNDPDCECIVIEPESLIPNPSFEDMNCCPSTRSQLDCAEVWIQASEPTTDFIHICGWMGWDNFPPPQPFPDGEGIMGFRDGRVFQMDNEPNWKEYAGACLLGPLRANTKYRFEFEVGFVDQRSSPPINITFFGSTDCENLPFGVGNDQFGCPTNGPGWVRLGSRGVSASSPSSWVKTSIDIEPKENITTIAIGPDCPAVQTTTSLYYFFDNLVLADLRSFEFQIKEVGHPCSSDFLLAVPGEQELTYQWYKEGVALINEKSFQLSKTYGEGDYQVRVLGEGICNLTKVFDYSIPLFYEQPLITICAEDVHQFGSELLTESGEYLDTFKTINNCDSIVKLILEVMDPKEDIADVKIFDGETYSIGAYSFRDAGEYSANLVTSQGCDSLVHIQLNYYSVYFPNVFSPNEDGRNDRFMVYGGGDLVEIRNLTIFDRWGGVIHSEDDLFLNDSEGWDGRHQGRIVNVGVYGYIATLAMNDGLERSLKGTVLLLR